LNQKDKLGGVFSSWATSELTSFLNLKKQNIIHCYLIVLLMLPIMKRWVEYFKMWMLPLENFYKRELHTFFYALRKMVLD